VTRLNLNVDVKRVVSKVDDEFVNAIVYFGSNPQWSEGDEERCNCLGECFPSVNLSRSGANPNCWLRLDMLSDHNHHAPPFQDETEMEGYIQRVTDAVSAAVESWESSTCSCNHSVDEDGEESNDGV